jgi:hypothetical protein
MPVDDGRLLLIYNEFLELGMGGNLAFQNYEKSQSGDSDRIRVFP